jgi:hypothetical protein
VRALLCGGQSDSVATELLLTRETLSSVTLGEVGNKGGLQQVTIEEHQVGDLVFVLLPLLIHIAEGHIDLTIVQCDTTEYNNY